MSKMLAAEPGRWACVLSTGDDFYRGSRWRCEADEERAFAALEREMLRHVPLPWLTALGNHDLGRTLALQRRRHGSSGPASAGGASGRWTWTCPSAGGYSLAEEWARRRSGGPSFPEGVLDLFVVNTNKFLMPAEPGSQTWEGQKQWLRRHLARSRARWKVVLGHHPVEFVPQNLLEHAIPGLRYFTATFMSGKPLVKKVFSSSLADAMILGGADAYVCGHQHLLAHLRRRAPPRRLSISNARGQRKDCDYFIVGSSSKTEVGATPPLGSRLRWKLEKVRGKMQEFWWEASIGFATLRATPDELCCEFFAVGPDGGARRVHCCRTGGCRDLT